MSSIRGHLQSEGTPENQKNKLDWRCNNMCTFHMMLASIPGEMHKGIIILKKNVYT